MNTKRSAVNEDSIVLWSRSVLLPVVLAIVASEGGSYGYRIKQIVEDSGLRRPVDGALYPLLRAAEAEGLLEISWDQGGAKPARMVCHITPVGIQRLHAERDGWATFTHNVTRLFESSITPRQESELDSS